MTTTGEANAPRERGGEQALQQPYRAVFVTCEGMELAQAEALYENLSSAVSSPKL